MRCLIIDDSEVIRKSLDNYLKDIYECDFANNGDDAADFAQKALEASTPYDLITLDINMPGIGGQKTLKLIRQLEAHNNIATENAVSIIMTTACDDRNNIIEAGRGGCQSYLVKPFTKKMMLDEIDKINAEKEKLKPKSKLKSFFGR
jgi:two-component system chemotaxis response regulator CheY